MGMSDLYGPADDTESIATIHAALDAGVTLLDTGDYYGMGHNELLLRDALRGRNGITATISGATVRVFQLKTSDTTFVSWTTCGRWQSPKAPPSLKWPLRGCYRVGCTWRRSWAPVGGNA
jgi:aryl-alcohol dehydrogenase-like predicted oxidoreductase